jgi:hypothetical protein
MEILNNNGAEQLQFASFSRVVEELERRRRSEKL